MGISFTMDMKEWLKGSYYQLLLRMAMDMVALPSAHDCLHSFATLPKVPQQLLLDREYHCKGAPGSTMQHHIFKPTRPYFLASASRLFCRIYGICLFVFWENTSMLGYMLVNFRETFEKKENGATEDSMF